MIAIIILAVFSFTSSGTFPENDLLLMDGELLKYNKLQIQSGNKSLVSLLKNHNKKSEEAIKVNKRFTVVNNHNEPTKASANHYFSLAPYWWPSSGHKGKYKQIDGKVNPERLSIGDYKELLDFKRTVSDLSISYYYTDSELYAWEAIKLIETWFIDERTLMLPTFTYGQVRIGQAGNTGGSAATADSYIIIQLLDSISLLKKSKYWTKYHNDKINAWYQELFEWMQTSKIGQMAKSNKNNIGTYYDIQMIVLGIYLKKDNYAKRYIEQVSLPRLLSQISDDGKQINELSRSKSWNYSVMNLKGLTIIARLSERLDLSLWKHAKAGPRLKNALEWMLPYYYGEAKWEYSQAKINTSLLTSLLKTIDNKLSVGENKINRTKLYDEY